MYQKPADGFRIVKSELTFWVRRSVLDGENDAFAWERKGLFC